MVKVSKRLAVNPVMTPPVITDPRKAGSASETPNPVAGRLLQLTPPRPMGGHWGYRPLWLANRFVKPKTSPGEPTCVGPLLGFLRNGGNRSRAAGRVSERR